LDVCGLTIEGAGTLRTTIVFDGNPGEPAILLESVRHGRVRDLAICPGTSKDLKAGIQIISSSSATTFRSTQNLIENVWIDGAFKSGATLQWGIIIGVDGDDANNDFHALHNVRVASYLRDGYLIDNSQVYDVIFDNCIGTGTWSTVSGTHDGNAGTIDVASGLFDSSHVGCVFEFTATGATFAFDVSAVATVGGTTTLTIGAYYYDPLAGIGTGAGTLRYGGQSTLNALSGNARFKGGGGGINLKADAVFGITNGSPHSLIDANWESSRRFFQTYAQAAGGTKGLIVRGNRFSGDELKAWNTHSILVQSPCNVDCSDNFLGEINDFYVQYAFGTGINQEMAMFSFRNNEICNAEVAGPDELFLTSPPTDCYNNRLYNDDSASYTRFDAVPWKKTSVSGAYQLEMVFPELDIELDGATTFTFSGLPSRSRRWMHLINTALDAVTWPTITWIGGSAPALTGDDWLIFWKEEGGTVWGWHVQAGGSGGSSTPQYACMHYTSGYSGPWRDIKPYDGETVTPSGIADSTTDGTVTVDTDGTYHITVNLDIDFTHNGNELVANYTPIMRLVRVRGGTTTLIPGTERSFQPIGPTHTYSVDYLYTPRYDVSPIVDLVSGDIVKVQVKDPDSAGLLAFTVLDGNFAIHLIETTGTGSGVAPTIDIRTAAGPYTAPDDRWRIIVVNQTVGAAFTQNANAAPAVGDILEIVDGKGDASTNNITVQGNGNNINGAASFVMSVDRQAERLVFTGTEWVRT
jgi:hypothetical protein